MAAQVTAGIVGGARGLKGEVFVEVRTDRPDTVFGRGSTLTLEAGEVANRKLPQGLFPNGNPKSLTVSHTQVHKGRRTCRFDQVTNRDQAEALRGWTLLTEESPEENAWYPHEVTGLEALSPDGEKLGVVTGLASGAAHDFLLVDTGEREAMIPLVSQIVTKVLVDEGVVEIEAPQGLFDL